MWNPGSSRQASGQITVLKLADGGGALATVDICRESAWNFFFFFSDEFLQSERSELGCLCRYLTAEGWPFYIPFSRQSTRRLASCVICSGFNSSTEIDRTKKPKQSDATAVYLTATAAVRQHFHCYTALCGQARPVDHFSFAIWKQKRLIIPPMASSDTTTPGANYRPCDEWWRNLSFAAELNIYC